MTAPRMERWYPRSFLTLLLVAFALAALPVVLAFLHAALQLDRLAGLSRSAVFQAASAARESRRMMEEVTALERVARQYLVLADGALLEDYAQLRRRFKDSTSHLALLPLDEGQLAQLNRTVEFEERLHERLRAPPAAPRERARLAADYAGLSDEAARMLAGSNDIIDREIAHLRDVAADAGRSLWWQLLTLLPVGVALALGLAFVVGRPVRQLDAAIRRIGSGEFAAPVRVSGPEDLRQLGERLEWLRGRLAELEAQRERFLRHVSHELKTPLTSIREGAELLADGTGGSLTPAQRDIAAILQGKSLELQRLIEKLIEYHRARADAGELALAPARLDAVVAAVIEDHRLPAAGKGLRVETVLAPVTLQADADRLRVVADNLLSNAVRYSPEGGRVVVRVHEQGGQAIVEVIDEGPGVPVSDRERIFDWFELGTGAGEAAGRARVRGSGLGLAIAREWVQAHRGSIEVADGPERGACFRVSLPLRPGDGA